MTKFKFLGAIFCAAVLWAGCSGSQQGNANNAAQPDNSGKSENVQPATKSESKPATAENLWRSYLTSDYCDVAIKDVDAAIKEIGKKGATVSYLTFDPFKNSVVSDNADPGPDGDVESDDSVLGFYNETLAYYPLAAGGTLVLVYSDCLGNGRCTLQVFKYSDGTLTRLKNNFPPFGNNVQLQEDLNFDRDKLVKFNGTEVWYFDYSYRINKFTESGFSLDKDHLPFATFNWNGAKFTTNDSL